MKKYIIASALAACVISLQPAMAQSSLELERGLNASGICAPIKFDLKKVAEYLGISLPSTPFPLDMSVGWDKNSHKVMSLTLDQNRKVSSGIELGCQPSSEAAVIKTFKLRPEDFRLKENVHCVGTLNADGSVPDLTCKPSGEVGKLLGAVNDLNGQMKPLFKSALSSH